MSDKPILFSGAMVQAIRDGRKTQTRRVGKKQPVGRGMSLHLQVIDNGTDFLCFIGGQLMGKCPYGRPGDRLWVRETWLEDTVGNIRYRATEQSVQDGNWKWRPSIFMPRWASRISLEVTAVRVEWVQDISEDDARAEGVWTTASSPRSSETKVNHIGAFKNLWNEINTKRGYSWSTNPWVWVVEFKQVETTP